MQCTHLFPQVHLQCKLPAVATNHNLSLIYHLLLVHQWLDIVWILTYVQHLASTLIQTCIYLIYTTKRMTAQQWQLGSDGV